jgi:hypothetical protein
MLVLDVIEILPPLGKYKYDTWRIFLVKCYIDNSVRLRSCIRNINNGDEGDDLIGKTIPSTVGSLPLHRLHGDALWESGRKVNASMDEIGYPSRCLCVFRGGGCCEE